MMLFMIFPYYLCNIRRLLSDTASHSHNVYNLVLLSLSLLLSRLEACRFYKSLRRIMFGFIDFLCVIYFIDFHFDLYYFLSSSYYCFNLLWYSYLFLNLGQQGQRFRDVYVFPK